MKRHKSALKCNRQNKKRKLINSTRRSALKTAVKKVDQAVQLNNAADASVLLAYAIPLLDKAAGKGLIHKNKASRKISRLTRKVNRLKTSLVSA